ncbi:autotransporter outer membrane beta-barrel domain-containing protein [Pseudomonas sp. GZD-222]|uniref:autotransporter outer membrane beta-barrel domain-containing protein n=1 Tax=Pseudomonas sp. GZD-222 TaxID=3404805 RepID=UPI003BB5C74A
MSINNHIKPPFPIKSVFPFFLPLLLSAPLVNAAIVDNGDSLVIDASTPVDGYTVRNGSSLTVNGATTRTLNINSGSHLQINGATIAGGAFDGLIVTNSTASVNDADITADFWGLAVNRQIGSTTGSQVTVDNSRIVGGVAGAVVTGGSTLQLNNSIVTGRDTGSSGINILGGEVIASSSRISGDTSGILIVSDPENLTDPRLVLDNTEVTGRTGPALLIEEGASATIELRNGATLVGADDVALLVRDASTAAVSLNRSELNGKVQVSADSSASLALDQAQWNGDFEVEAGGTGSLSLANRSSFTGRLVNVEQLSIGNQSSYTMTEDTRLGTLAMNGGRVNMGSENSFYTLNVANLSGSGVFAMNVDFSSNQHDVLNVTQNAGGNHQLLIADSGVDPSNPEQLTLVRTAAGDAEFSLYNGKPVAVGAWAYELSSVGNGTGGTDWFLDPEKRSVSPGTRTVMALFNTAPTVWYGELTSLRSRMGELRFNGGQPGLWMRSYGNKYNVADASGTGYQQKQHGLSIGADGRLPWGDGQWLAGGLVGYSKSDLDLDEGTSGSVDSYYIGAYTTWLDAESGYYFDGLAKLNRFQNRAKVAINDGSHSKGDYDNVGTGVSAEFGRHIPLSDGYFIEPFTQWSAVVIQGKDFSLDNGLEADGERTHSLLGKAGMTAGRTFELANGGKLQPYLRGAWAHEFAKGNAVKVNNNRFNNDLSGSRGELGTGLALGLKNGLQVHLDLEYANGEHIEQPYGVNLGLRYDF